MKTKSLLSTASLALAIAAFSASAQAQIAIGHLADYSGGTSDVGTPYGQAVAFRDKAVQLGVNVKLVPFEGRGHGFFNKGRGQPGDWDRASNEMLSFLRGLGWL